MNKQELIAYIAENYGVYGEFPWAKYPDNIVFRHSNNKKWFALIITVSKEKLGLSECGLIDIVNVKCEPVMIDSLKKEKGIYAAYHMNKTNWISVVLDDSVSDETIKMVIDMSFRLTALKIRKSKVQKEET